MILAPLAMAALVAVVAGCGGSDGSGGGAGSSGGAGSGGSGGSGGPAMAGGCPVLSSPQPAMAGDTWDTFAKGFFASYCTRCHSTTLVGAQARNGAPAGFDWDDEASVKAHLDAIRDAVGVGNFMPPDAPAPNCDERKRIVAWIDAKAP